MPREPFECTELVDPAMVQRLVHNCAEHIPEHLLRRLRRMIRDKRFCLDNKYTAEPGRRMRSGNSGAKDMEGVLRRLLMGEMYYDLDLVNAAPTVFYCLAEHNGLSVPALAGCIEHREAVLENLMTEQEVDRTTAKKMVTAAIYQGETHNSEFLRAIQIEARTLADELFEDESFAACLEVAQRKVKEGRNLRGSFLSAIYCHIEADLIFYAARRLQKRGIEVGALTYDGMLVRKTTPMKELSEAIEAIERAWAKKGYTLKLAYKALAPTPADFQWLEDRERVPESSVSKTGDKLRAELTALTREQRLVRFKNECWAPHPTVPGALVSNGTLANFINKALAHSELYQTEGTLVMLLPWAETTQHPDWPLLSDDDFKPHVALFRDGWLDMETNRFYAHDPPRATFVWDVQYKDVRAQATPLWDRLLLTQIRNQLTATTRDAVELSEDEAELLLVIEGMLGRGFFINCAVDLFKTAMMIIGPGDTGKGTLLAVFSKMFPNAGYIGEIDSNSRKADGFGLQQLVNRRVLMARDCPRDLQKYFPTDLLAKMISGEAVQVPHLHNVNVGYDHWPSSMIAAANYMIQMDNAGDRMLRRWLFINFSFIVDPADYINDLEDRIIETELAAVFVRLCASYKRLRDKVGQGRLLDACPHVRSLQAEMGVKIDPLVEFLTDGSDYWQVSSDPGTFTTIETVRKAFAAHCKFVLHEEHKWKADQTTFKRLGYKYDRIHVCTTCGLEATRENCEGHYDRQSRRRAYVIKGLRLTKIRDERAPDPSELALLDNLAQAEDDGPKPRSTPNHLKRAAEEDIHVQLPPSKRRR